MGINTWPVGTMVRYCPARMALTGAAATRKQNKFLLFQLFWRARYVADGNDGIRVSSDSVTWTAPTTVPSAVPFTACTWTGDEFLACGLGEDKNPTIYTSPDGDVWTLRDTTIKASLRAAITIDGAIYVAGDSVIAKSTDDGSTWTDTFNNTGGNRLFMGLASDGKDLIAAGFNHNVWAIPLSVGAAATSGGANNRARCRGFVIQEESFVLLSNVEPPVPESIWPAPFSSSRVDR